MTADKVVGDPCARLGVDRGATDIKIVVEIQLWGYPSEWRRAFHRTRCIVPRASSDHRLNVSISVAAHTPFRVPLPAPIQPACEMLLPRLPTCITASSSSGSSAFDTHTSPSVDPDSKRLRDRSEDREKFTVVMSSEWVEVCFLSGAEGCRGSLHVYLLKASGLRAARQSERTNIGPARRPLGAPSRPRPSNHPKIRRRKGEISVSLQISLGFSLSRYGVQYDPVTHATRTLNRCSTSAVIPYTHDTVLPRRDYHSLIYAS